MWFEEVFGFKEKRNYDKNRALFRVERGYNESITLHTNPKSNNSDSRSFHVGIFETPSVRELQGRLSETKASGSLTGNGSSGQYKGLSFEHIVGDAGDLHRDPKNEGAVFQAASQFNCLEMVSPTKTPENGITGYAYDKTQGPSCALACPAGTLYRNYFVNGAGQGNGKQLDMLCDIDDYVGNNTPDCNRKYWSMENGYAMASTRTSIAQLHQKLESKECNTTEIATLLRVGVHWDTEVHNYHGSGKLHNVSQVYCSALPIGYDNTSSTSMWRPFAQAILSGTYEATLAVAAILARERGQRVSVYLTKVGGGVFGNDPEWIKLSIQQALDKHREEPIDVFLVHYMDMERCYTDTLPQIKVRENKSGQCN